MAITPDAFSLCLAEYAFILILDNCNSGEYEYDSGYDHGYPAGGYFVEHSEDDYDE